MRESGKSIGKKNRKAQRSVLKEVLEALQAEGECPPGVASSRHTCFVRSGFQTHLVENEVLRDVFEVTENANAKIGLVCTVKRRADLKAKAVQKPNDMSRKDLAQNAVLNP
ncbi:Interferon- developmental regulator 1 [Phytophthora pseudosyringae]|uniref:Interferon- developmental regulator 1 n=1 Tax=Phytophthora pseudosyringae TaxID=221518 RepID=A0A8T1VA91_9STRA|nr:Interferon- developmental regulator 1 [Phytophthora pseudosyringae]